ncbi:MAG: hypothetical protein H7Y20_05555, partial [Bryobacteraceae bacterium]|nr:hypothetical protein [Bryobacteraceae bacterium]
TMIAKLAVRYGLTGRKPLHLISLDGSRVGGTDSLRAYAAGMGISLETVETGAALNQAIESHPSAGLILIDTSGLGPADLDGASEIAQALARNIEVDVQLVVSATSSPADLKATFTRFRMFLPSRILVTNVDAAVSCRPVIGLSLANETALSFLGTGGRVPEDLEEASVPCLLRLSGAKAGRTAVSAA